MGAITADMGMVVVVLVAAIGNINGQQVATLAVGTDAISNVLAGVEREAVATNSMACRAGAGWEEIAKLRGTREEGFVEALQIAAAIEAIAALADHGGGPGGGTAVAAMDDRQMGAGFCA